MIVRLPTTYGSLYESHQTGYKNHRGDNIASCRIVLSHAEGWCQYERDGNDGANHGQVMLKTYHVYFSRCVDKKDDRVSLRKN